MIYKGINILDQNLKPLDSIGIGGDWKEKILGKISNWAESHKTKIVSLVRLVHPGEASAFGVDDVISIGNRETGTVKFGIWKVYGSTSAVPKGNPRGRHRYLDWKKTTEEAAEESSKRKRKKSVQDMSPEEKKQMVADMMKKGIVVESAERRNPRKKEMKMGIPDKKTSLFKIIDEIDETPNEYRFRMQPTSKFHEKSLKYGKKSITKGVRAIYGCPKAEWAPRLEKCKKGMAMQALRLSKNVFHSKTEAAGWIAKHTKPRRE